jgi:hypothetical protein
MKSQAVRTVLLAGLLVLALGGCAVSQSQPMPAPVNIRGEIDPDYLRRFTPPPPGWNGAGASSTTTPAPTEEWR